MPAMELGNIGVLLAAHTAVGGPQHDHVPLARRDHFAEAACLAVERGDRYAGGKGEGGQQERQQQHRGRRGKAAAEHHGVSPLQV